MKDIRCAKYRIALYPNPIEVEGDFGILKTSGFDNMTTINRYIIGELLKTFIFALIVMTPFVVVVGVVKRLLTEDIPLKTVVSIVPHIVIEMSPILLPMTLLLTVTVFFSRMSGANEVIALKSLGIAPWKFLWPVMFFGLLVSLLSVWLNDLAVTWGHRGIAVVLYQAAEEIILNKLEKKLTFTSPGNELTIIVKGVDKNKRLISPSISIKNPPSTIDARYAKLSIDFSHSELNITFFEMKADSSGNVKYTTDSRTIALPLGKVLALEPSKRPAETGLQDIPSAIAQIEERSAEVKRRMAARQAFACSLGSVNEWAMDDWSRWQLTVKNNQKSIDRYAVEAPRRWSSGFCCLCFIWLGAPLAVWMKKTDIFASFFACFVPILLFYYPLFMLGLQWAKEGTLPAHAVWIGNLALLVAGYWFWKRIHRY